MELGLTGRHALVLAGTRGLGLATAKSLAEEGVKLAIIGRDRDNGLAAAAEIANQAAFIPGDLSQSEFRSELPALAENLLGNPIDILVTNAGGPATGEFHEQNLDAWRKAYELNLFGHIDIAQRLVPAMAERGFGRIVNITSFVAKEPYPNMSLSNSVRVALHGAMASLAKEVAGRGVTVNNVMPGLMDTGALKRVIDARAAKNQTDTAKVRDGMAAEIPLGRLGNADEFGPLCAFLCSPLASYITGQSIAVDGGLIHGM